MYEKPKQMSKELLNQSYKEVFTKETKLEPTQGVETKSEMLVVKVNKEITQLLAKLEKRKITLEPGGVSEQALKECRD